MREAFGGNVFQNGKINQKSTLPSTLESKSLRYGGLAFSTSQPQLQVNPRLEVEDEEENEDGEAEEEEKEEEQEEVEEEAEKEGGRAA